MFGRRPDGKTVKNVDPLIRITPHIMPKRYDAQVFVRRALDYDIIKEYLKKKREEGIKLTHMDVIIAAYIKVANKYPEFNRFIVNRKLYQRNELTVSLAILKDIIDGKVYETTIKVKFDPNDTIFDVSRKMNEEIEKNRKADNKNFTDKLIRFFLAIPLIPGVAIGFVKSLDKIGLLPKFILDALPFHTSFFITNMASIRMGYVYHHIYDFGTTSIFASIGTKETKIDLDRENNIVKKSLLPMGIVIDERVCSGAEYALGFNYFEKLLKNPESLEV